MNVHWIFPEQHLMETACLHLTMIPRRLSLLLYSFFELLVSPGFVKSKLLCVHSKSQETVSHKTSEKTLSKEGVLEETVVGLVATGLGLWSWDVPGETSEQTVSEEKVAELVLGICPWKVIGWRSNLVLSSKDSSSSIICHPQPKNKFNLTYFNFILISILFKMPKCFNTSRNKTNNTRSWPFRNVFRRFKTGHK